MRSVLHHLRKWAGYYVKKMIDYRFRTKSIESILYGLTFFCLAEWVGLENTEQLQGICNSLKVDYPDGFVHYLILLFELVFVKGSKVLIRVSFLFIMYFTILYLIKLDYIAPLKKLFINPATNLIKSKPIGRESDYKRFFQLLKKNNRIAIYGEGGIGKTTFIQYFLSKKKKNFHNLIYLNIDSIFYDDNNANEYNIASFVNGFTNNLMILKVLNLSQGHVYFELNVDQKIEYIINELSEVKGRNLLVIDNATKLIEVGKYDELLSKLYNSNWKIIVTTRTKFSSYKEFQLTQLSSKTLFDIFHRIYQIRGRAKLMKIFERYNFHPLTVELLASHSKRLKWDCNNLTEVINESGLTRIEEINIHSPQTNETNKNLIQLLIESFRLNLPREQSDLLKIFSLLPNKQNFDGINERNIKVWSRFLGFNSDVHLINTLNSMYEHSWLKKNESSSFYAHPVIQEVSFKSFQPNIMDDKTSSFIQKVLEETEEITENEGKRITDYPQYLDLLFSISTKLPSQGNFSEKEYSLLTKLYWHTAYFFDIIGYENEKGNREHDIAIRFINKADEFSKNSVNSTLKGNVSKSKGIILEKVRASKIAILAFNSAIEFYSKNEEENCKAIIQSLELLSDIHRSLTQFDEMFKCLKNASSIAVKHRGNTTRSTFRRFIEYYIEVENFSKAYEYLQILETELQEDNFERLNFLKVKLNYFFLYYVKTKRETAIKQATKIADELVQLSRDVYPEINENLAINLDDSASVYRLSKDLEKALEYSMQAVRIFEKLNIKGLEIAYSNIARIHHQIGNYDEALSFYSKSNKFYKKDALDKAKNYDNMAAVVRSSGSVEYEVMIEYSKRAQRIFEIHWRNAPSSLLINYSNLSALHKFLGNRSYKTRDKNLARNQYYVSMEYLKKMLDLHQKANIETDPSIIKRIDEVENIIKLCD